MAFDDDIVCFKPMDNLLATFRQTEFELNYEAFIAKTPAPSIDEVERFLLDAKNEGYIFGYFIKHEMIDNGEGVLMLVQVIDHEGANHISKLPYSKAAYEKSFLFEVDSFRVNFGCNGNDIDVDSRVRDEIESNDLTKVLEEFQV